MDALTADELRLLREHMDRQAIRDAIEFHLHGLDSRDFDGIFGRAYTDDATFSVAGGTEFHRGRLQMLEMNSRMTTFSSTIHSLCNTHISLHGDSARSITYAVAWLHVTEGPRAPEVISRGIRYLHEWKRYGPEWRSDRMEHIPLWQVHLPSVDPQLPIPVMRPTDSSRGKGAISR
jgi:hypothetical protein